MRIQRILTPTLFISIVLPCSAAVRPEGGRLPDLDPRAGAQAAQPLQPEREAALRQLKRRIAGAEVEMDPLFQTPNVIQRRHRPGFLSGPDPQFSSLPLDRVPPELIPPGMPVQALRTDYRRPVKRFLARHATAIGHGPEVLESATVKRDYVTAHNGMRTMVWEQQLDGIPVHGAVLMGSITKYGELVSLSSHFLPDLKGASGLQQAERANLRAQPPISARDAVVRAAGNVGDAVRPDEVSPLGERGEATDRRTVLRARGLSGDTSALGLAAHAPPGTAPVLGDHLVQPVA